MFKNANNIISYFRKYTRYDLKREVLSWIKLGKFYLPIMIPAAIAVGAVLIYVKPAQLGQTFLAIG